MSRKNLTPQEEAIRALDARLESIRVRLSHAQLARDKDKVTSLTKKLSRAMGQLARLRRKNKS